MHPTPMETTACTLDRDALEARRSRWHALAACALARIEETETGLRLRFTGGAAELAALTALERQCCAFATWTVEGTTLAVDGSTPEAVPAVHGMFRSLRI